MAFQNPSFFNACSAYMPTGTWAGWPRPTPAVPVGGPSREQAARREAAGNAFAVHPSDVLRAGWLAEQRYDIVDWIQRCQCPPRPCVAWRLILGVSACHGDSCTK